ncbi:DMT family transporter [Jonesiaceae bacterium BS-20]|uniref:DMT family transporter n=1 Tax=Jonesiaceae bacterium BS-20 TaxID=3120821 RepID=A0AAU7DU42_9MICO
MALSEKPNSASAKSTPGKETTVGFAAGIFVLLTVLAGALGPMQSAVNGQLGKVVADGHLAAVISFGSGLVFMLIVILPQTRLRNALFALPGQLRRGVIPWPNFFAGLCGAVIVLSEGVSVGALGVATFQTSLISGMVISGVVCDRLGIGANFKQALSLPRIAGAILAIVATLLVVSPNFQAPHLIALAILPFAGGLLAGWQPAGNSNVGKVADSMMVAITWNFIIGFTALTLVFLARLGTGNATFTMPTQWWMYLGGPLGLASIAAMALLVRRLGLLLLALASTAGQLIGSISIDSLIPALGNTVYAVTIIGAVVALFASGIAMIPSKKVAKTEPELAPVP